MNANGKKLDWSENLKTQEMIGDQYMDLVNKDIGKGQDPENELKTKKNQNLVTEELGNCRWKCNYVCQYIGIKLS